MYCRYSVITVAMDVRRVVRGWRFGRAFMLTVHTLRARVAYTGHSRIIVTGYGGPRRKVKNYNNINIVITKLPTQRGLARFSRGDGRTIETIFFFFFVQQVLGSCTDAFCFVIARTVPVHALDSISSLLRDDLLTRTLTRFHHVFSTWLFSGEVRVPT